MDLCHAYLGNTIVHIMSMASQIREMSRRCLSAVDSTHYINKAILRTIINCSSLNVLDYGAELLVSVFWTLSIVIVFFQNHYVLRDGSSPILK
jgi:hypothetical protein